MDEPAFLAAAFASDGNEKGARCWRHYNMLNGQRDDQITNQKSRFPWRSALAVAGCVCALADSSPLLSWGLLRTGSCSVLAGLPGDWESEISARPVTLEGVVRATNSGNPKPRNAARIEVSLNWPWHAFSGTGGCFIRWLSRMSRCGGFASGRRDASRFPTVRGAAARGANGWQWLPEYFEMRHGNLDGCPRSLFF
jgi:hypothetical protein